MIEEYTRSPTANPDYPRVTNRDNLKFGELYRDRFGDYHVYWTKDEDTHWAIYIAADGGAFRAYHVDDNDVLSFGVDWYLDINPSRLVDIAFVSNGKHPNIVVNKHGVCMRGVLGKDNPRSSSYRDFNWKAGFVGNIDGAEYMAESWAIWASKEESSNLNKTPILSYNSNLVKKQRVAA